MSTLRKLVSDIRGTHRILSTDSMITDRVIASEIRNASLLLIKRETNLRKLWSTDSIFTTISECSDYVDDCTIARSKFKIPRVAEGNYQYVIQGVYSINALGGKGKKLKEITVNRYINLLSLPVIKNEEYFWITNDYLYVSNPLVEAIRIVAYFEKDVPNKIMFSDCNCGNSPDIEEYCKNPLDKEFALPGYLEKQVLQLTSETLVKTYFSIKNDNTQDGIDGQAPNSGPTR
jgi:hypothetical protein